MILKKCLKIFMIAVGIQASSGCQQSIEKDVSKDEFTTDMVTIKRSQFGMAHISANNLYGLGYGNAYAQAQDHVCILADGYLRVKGERAKYLGANKTPNDNHYVMSDFGHRILDLYGRTERAYESFSDNTKEISTGFAAGYNAYLAAVKSGKESLAKECEGQDWVKPITAVDVVANIVALGVQSSAGRFMPAMVKADPGSQKEWFPTLAAKSTQHWPLKIAHLNLDQQLETQGSNGWALGKNKTENGKGILLANPHFPFNGNFRFWSHQAQIPGKLNVMGASVVGFPGVVNIGFNSELAWTHTFSAAKHAVIYRLPLDPNNPLRYQVDGQWHDIDQQQIDIEVKTLNGLITLTKKTYQTDVGIIIEDDRRFPWDKEFVYVIKEANIENFESIEHWLAINQSNSMETFKASFKRFDGMLFNNTLAADKEGNTFYIDDSNVPKLSESALHLLKTDPKISKLFKNTGIPVLPGHKSDFIFSKEVSFNNAPKIERDDYVQNANDSYWLTNNELPLLDYSPLYGSTQSQQSLRTRQSLLMLEKNGGVDNLFNALEVESALLNHETYFKQFMPEILQICNDYSGQNIKLKEDEESVAVSVDNVCDAVKLWDGTLKLTSKSAHLILEFAEQLDYKSDFEIPFDPLQPQSTPSGLRRNYSVIKKLLIAAKNIQTAGFTLTTEFSNIQFLQKGEYRIPWPGAAHRLGGFNVFSTANHMDLTSFSPSLDKPILDYVSKRKTYSGLTKSGRSIHFGSSWMMVVAFTEEGPKARGLLSFSQSADSRSNHFADQSKHYSETSSLLDLPFTSEALEAQIVSELNLLIEKD